MPFGQLAQLAVTVRDVPGAVHFYRDVLGIPFLFEAPPKLAFFDCGGVRLMISEPEGVPNSGNSAIYFKVDDIAGEHRRLTAAGVKFAEEPHRIARLADREVWLAAFHDPEGNLLALMSEPAISGAHQP
jgi:methylmalonyl-CoA/ethylmalonyl-CoA epimerase